MKSFDKEKDNPCPVEFISYRGKCLLPVKDKLNYNDAKVKLNFLEECFPVQSMDIVPLSFNVQRVDRPSSRLGVRWSTK